MQKNRKENSAKAFSYRYLAAKRHIDDRSLNHQVWRSFVHDLPLRAVDVLEVGAGIGTMAERFVERGVLPAGSSYTALDHDPDLLALAEKRLARAITDVRFHPQIDDIFDFAAKEQGRNQWDVLVAHAFLDLVDLQRALPALFSLLRPQGRFYFTINFDGLTILEPSIERAFDQQVMALYHRTMDERQVDGRLSGHSQTGRRLFEAIPAANGRIIAAGSSDWVLFPSESGYSTDETLFLNHLLDLLEQSLHDHAELEASTFQDWMDKRREQLDSRELILIAHQLDFYGRLPPAGS